MKPSCLIVDEVGRCTFDKACTDLFFDVVDRRYEKDCANTMILTSNTPTNNWDEFFTGDDTLLCTLDRLFDRASVFVMKGAASAALNLRSSQSRQRRWQLGRPHKAAEGKGKSQLESLAYWRN